MPRKDRTHILSDAAPSGDDLSTPKFLTKEEFGRRLYKLMIGKGWRQSELARRADLPRDSISSYVRGRTYPTPKSVEKLAAALGVEPERVLPNMNHNAILEDRPSFELKVSPGDPSKAWLKIDRQVSFTVGTKIAAMLEEDASDRD